MFDVNLREIRDTVHLPCLRYLSHRSYHTCSAQQESGSLHRWVHNHCKVSALTLCEVRAERGSHVYVQKEQGWAALQWRVLVALASAHIASKEPQGCPQKLATEKIGKISQTLAEKLLSFQDRGLGLLRTGVCAGVRVCAGVCAGMCAGVCAGVCAGACECVCPLC